MGQDCCTADPSQDNVNTETSKHSEGDSYKTKSKEKSSPNGHNKTPIPETSQSSLNVPNNNNAYSSDDPEESLNPPSRIDSILEASGHDPLPPSDAEDPYDEEEEDKYKDNAPEVPQPAYSGNGAYEQEQNQSVSSSYNNGRVEGADNNEQNRYQQPPKPKHRQLEILENDDLRQRSVKLVTSDNNEFIKFLKKILKSKLNEKIWSKCDPNGSGKIETEKFMYFWTLPVTLFKVAVFQRRNNTKEKPKLDQKELKKEFTHLATWIIRKYGERGDDGGSTFTLTKENFAKDIVDYVKKYAESKGVLDDDY